MTSSTHSDDATSKSATSGRPKKRRKKKRKAAEQEAPPPAPPPVAREGFARALAFLVVAIGAALFYVYAAPSDTNRPFALVGVGVAAFLCGASPGLNPQRSVAVFGGLVAIGLAIVGIRASEIGTVLAMGGGLGLGGGIHRLGRMGPDEGTTSAGSDTPVPGATGS